MVRFSRIESHGNVVMLQFLEFLFGVYTLDLHRMCKTGKIALESHLGNYRREYGKQDGTSNLFS